MARRKDKQTYSSEQDDDGYCQAKRKKASIRSAIPVATINRKRSTQGLIDMALPMMRCSSLSQT